MMKDTRKVLSQSTLKDTLRYDPITGVFTWLDTKPGNNRIFGKKAGSVRGIGAVNKYYVLIRIDGKHHLAHRLAFLYMNGSFPEHDVDHINGNGADNRWINLRLATRSENGKNQKRHSNNTSGVSGVCWRKDSGSWRVRITVDGEMIRLGSYKDKEEAIRIRRAAEEEYGFHINHGTDRPSFSSNL